MNTIRCTYTYRPRGWIGQFPPQIICHFLLLLFLFLPFFTPFALLTQRRNQRLGGPSGNRGRQTPRTGRQRMISKPGRYRLLGGRGRDRECCQSVSKSICSIVFKSDTNSWRPVNGRRRRRQPSHQTFHRPFSPVSSSHASPLATATVQSIYRKLRVIGAMIAFVSERQTRSSFLPRSHAQRRSERYRYRSGEGANDDA